MTYSKFLTQNRHKSVFYFRSLIPVHLRPYFASKKYLKRTTETSNKIDATHRARQLRCYCHDLFLTLEADMKKRRRSESPKTITTGLVTGPFGDIDFGGDSCPKGRKKEIKLYKEQLKFAKQNPELAKAMLSSRSSNAPVASKAAVQPPVCCTEVFDQLITRLQSRVGSRENGLSEKTFNEYLPRYKFWSEALKDVNAADVNRAMVADIHSWLHDLTPGFSKLGMSVTQAVDLAKAQQSTKVLSAKSFNNYALPFTAFLDQCYKLGIHTEKLTDLFERRDDKSGTTIKRLPFTDNDIKLIFPGERYVTAIKKYGHSNPIAARFWVPLIAFYSGARLEEICQLTVGDVVTDADTGIQYFNITTGESADGKKQRLKNQNSERPIPVHSKLIETGFNTYLTGLLADKSQNLFGLKRSSNGSYGKEIGRWFSLKSKTTKGYIERMGVVSSGVDETGHAWSKSFHSIRHTVVDNLRDEKFLPNGQRVTITDIALLVGHIDDLPEAKLQTNKYGLGQRQLKVRRDLVENIIFDSISGLNYNN